MKKSKIKHFFLLVAVLLFLSCKTVQPVAGVSHCENNTQISTSQDKERDSIFVEVEKIVYRDGDTVYITNTKTEYRDRWRVKVDSFLVETTVVDSIPYPVPTPYEVEKEVPYIPGWIWVLLVANCLFIAWKVKKVIGK